MLYLSDSLNPIISLHKKIFKPHRNIFLLLLEKTMKAVQEKSKTAFPIPSNVTDRPGSHFPNVVNESYPRDRMPDS